jgi:hypothetical protein
MSPEPIVGFGSQSEEPDGPFKRFNVSPGRVCIPNINASERRKRLNGGIITVLIGLVVLGGLLAFGAGRPWRLVLLPIFWSAAVGFFQWRDRT